MKPWHHPSRALATLSTYCSDCSLSCKDWSALPPSTLFSSIDSVPAGAQIHARQQQVLRFPSKVWKSIFATTTSHRRSSFPNSFHQTECCTDIRHLDITEWQLPLDATAYHTHLERHRDGLKTVKWGPSDVTKLSCNIRAWVVHPTNC